MKKHTGPQIVAKLREADMALGQGLTVPAVCKKLGISEQTYYRWRQKYGGMSPAAIQELKACRRRTPASRSWWPTRRWTMRS